MRILRSRQLRILLKVTGGQQNLVSYKDLSTPEPIFFTYIHNHFTNSGALRGKFMQCLLFLTAPQHFTWLPHRYVRCHVAKTNPLFSQLNLFLLQSVNFSYQLMALSSAQLLKPKLQELPLDLLLPSSDISKLIIKA